MDKILKTPAEIKVDRTKEDEASAPEPATESKKAEPTKEKSGFAVPEIDEEAVALMNRYKNFGAKTPEFLLLKGELAGNEA